MPAQGLKWRVCHECHECHECLETKRVATDNSDPLSSGKGLRTYLQVVLLIAGQVADREVVTTLGEPNSHAAVVVVSHTAVLGAPKLGRSVHQCRPPNLLRPQSP
eukprot:1189774-Prorocentrum_minimum.AAC.1